MRPEPPVAKIAAVVFDFDGTLTQPGAIDFAGMRREIGCPEGTPILEYVDDLAGGNPDMEAILDRYEMEAAARAVPNDGAEELVVELIERGLPLAILTRNVRRAVVRSFENFPRLVPDLFAAILARDDQLRPKPDPEGIFRLSHTLDVPVAAMLCVGDYDFDVEIAHRAGCLSAYLTNGRTTTAMNPDFTIEKLSELLPIIATV